MGYIPTEWQTGDIITAAKLNKAEEGIEAAYPYTISFYKSGGEITCSETWDDLRAIIYRDHRAIFAYIDDADRSRIEALYLDEFVDDIPEESQAGRVDFVTEFKFYNQSDLTTISRYRISFKADNTFTYASEPEPV